MTVTFISPQDSMTKPTRNQGDPHRRLGSLEQVHIGDCVAATVRPVVVREVVGRLRESHCQVRWDINLNPELLWVPRSAVGEVGLRVTPRNQYPSVHKESGLRVIHTGDDGGVEDGEARADGFIRGVEDCGEIGVFSEAETSFTMVGAVHDHYSTVGKVDDAGHDTARWLGWMLSSRADVEECKPLTIRSILH